MSEQSPTFPVFDGRPAAQSAEEIEDPLHIADRDSDELEEEVATAQLDLLPSLPAGAAYVLTPREGVRQFSAGAHPTVAWINDPAATKNRPLRRLRRIVSQNA